MFDLENKKIIDGEIVDATPEEIEKAKFVADKIVEYDNMIKDLENKLKYVKRTRNKLIEGCNHDIVSVYRDPCEGYDKIICLACRRRKEIG